MGLPKTRVVRLIFDSDSSDFRCLMPSLESIFVTGLVSLTAVEGKIRVLEEVRESERKSEGKSEGESEGERENERERERVEGKSEGERVRDAYRMGEAVRDGERE